MSGNTATLTITKTDGMKVEKLFTVMDGADGAQGPKGDTGPQGPQGPQGPAGSTATPGEVGSLLFGYLEGLLDSSDVHYGWSVELNLSQYLVAANYVINLDGTTATIDIIDSSGTQTGIVTKGTWVNLSFSPVRNLDPDTYGCGLWQRIA